MDHKLTSYMKWNIYFCNRKINGGCVWVTQLLQGFLKLEIMVKQKN